MKPQSHRTQTPRSCIPIIAGFLVLIAPTASADTDSLRAAISRIISSASGVIGVSIECLESRGTLTVNGTYRFPMQSVYKFPLALAVLDRVDRGFLSLDQIIHISTTDLLPDTWSPLRVKFPAANVDLPLREILRVTVSESDNNGCDILFRLLGGTDTVQAYIHSLGISGIAIAATEEAMHKDWSVQFTNWCTPPAMMKLLTLFYEGKILSRSSTDFLRTVMEKTTTAPRRLRGRLPDGTVVAHKTGSSGANELGIAAATNDVGIITLPDGRHFAIVVFVCNSPAAEAERDAAIAAVTGAAWEHFLQR